MLVGGLHLLLSRRRGRGGGKKAGGGFLPIEKGCKKRYCEYRTQNGRRSSEIKSAVAGPGVIFGTIFKVQEKKRKWICSE